MKRKDPWQAEMEKMARDADARADRRMREIYESLASFRRVPPPESIANALLRRIQSGSCFVCQCRSEFALPRESGLVEDHDHETGMVRSLLCSSCNASEGAGVNSIWLTYRQFAPANGWYYRYFGRGQQWDGSDPDPLQKRVNLFSEREATLDSESCLKRYIEAASTMPSTPAPASQRRFGC